MCILCVVQRWSRRVATMLPWLVVPLIALWAASQLLPPGLRFEVTSPRLACVLVLLVTLFWYEVLMPRLSLWRERRSARLRERRRAQALELQKLRRAATRRCRNCHTPYRDQNPGGGRFMCACCGHVSRRPVLDLPTPPALASGWICAADCPAADPSFWLNPPEKSYPSAASLFASRLFSCCFASLWWLCGKVFRFGSSGDDRSSRGDTKCSSKKGDGGGGCQESRGEKARRKAEEKRQARLERELLEEEERKQREEVARLVEERRRLRDEMLEAERMHSRGSARDRERESRKEAERRRRQERRQDKDKGSSKSNSDVEEFDRRASRENERKRDFDRRSENERRDGQRTAVENYRSYSSEAGHGVKVAVAASKPRYFDRVKGSFLSSSRGFTGASFWGRNAQTSVAPVARANNSASVSWQQWTTSSGGRRDVHPVGQINNLNRPVRPDVKPQTPAPKKGWLHLFSRSPDVSSSKDLNALQHQNQNGLSDDKKISVNYSSDKQVIIGQSLPFSTPSLVNGSLGGNHVSHLGTNSIYKEPGQSFVLEEAERFEDPCFIPDPVSLRRPVSESISLPVDLGAGFIVDSEESLIIKNETGSTDVSKSSPIESPVSRVWGSEEGNTGFDQLPPTPKSSNLHASNLDDSSNAHKQGTWQMWGSPLAQNDLGLVTGSSSWFSPLGQNKPNKEDIMHPLSQNPVISQISMENLVVHTNHSPPKVLFDNYQNGGTPTSLGSGMNDSNLWVQQSLFQPFPVNGKDHFPPLNIARNELIHDSPKRSAVGNHLELSSVDCWSKKLWGQNGPQDAGISTPSGAQVRGLFSTSPDTQSVWSFNQKESI